MMEVDQVEERQLVNGGLMKNYIGKTVQIWLNTTDNTTGGRQFQGTTTDKKTVTVALETPLNQPLSGWIEVIGAPTASGSINCSEIIVFPNDENTEPLDEQSHNDIILAMLNMRDFYECGGDGSMF